MSVNVTRLHVFPHRQGVQEQRLLRGRLRLLRGDSVEDGLRVDGRVVLDSSSALNMPVKQLARRGGTALDLVNGGRNEVALAYGVEQAE